MYPPRSGLAMLMILICIGAAAAGSSPEPAAQRPPITLLSNHSVLESSMPPGPPSTAEPSIKATIATVPEGVEVSAQVTSPAGNLASATAYIVDNQSRTVLWTKYWVISGSSADLNMTWPRQETNVSNGISSVGPVLAVNTVGVPANEAPYLAYSIPCLIETTAGKSSQTMLAYFGTDGEFHELADTKGVIYYKSIELARATMPDITYGQYLKDNVTFQEGQAQLMFLNLNIDKGLTPYPPLIFARSPLLHYGLRIEMAAASVREAVLEIEATDSEGHVVRYLSNIGG
ncbi:MAG TPA: hypothetical protein VN455_10935 [Methanotrichaceae archaeon]|nr:hypothetical protein [Methanotrichaceae archaeon]